MTIKYILVYISCPENSYFEEIKLMFSIIKTNKMYCCVKKRYYLLKIFLFNFYVIGIGIYIYFKR